MVVDVALFGAGGVVREGDWDSDGCLASPDVVSISIVGHSVATRGSRTESGLKRGRRKERVRIVDWVRRYVASEGFEAGDTRRVITRCKAMTRKKVQSTVLLANGLTACRLVACAAPRKGRQS